LFDKYDADPEFTRSQNIENPAMVSPSGVYQQQQQQPQVVYVVAPQQQLQQQQQAFNPKLGHPVQVTQQMVPPGQVIQQMVQPGQPIYQTSTPLNLLNRYAAPVDCPACGQRGITRIAYIVGNTTQWVALPSHPRYTSIF
jgi:lipopolysaccharide-induced tumor necrosis factor-alpha factor